MADHKIKVHVKSQAFQPRGKAGEYRPGSVQILDSSEAYELEAAGIVMIVEDPYAVPAANDNPYLQPEPSEDPVIELTAGSIIDPIIEGDAPIVADAGNDSDDEGDAKE